MGGTAQERYALIQGNDGDEQRKVWQRAHTGYSIAVPCIVLISHLQTILISLNTQVLTQQNKREMALWTWFSPKHVIGNLLKP